MLPGDSDAEAELLAGENPGVVAAAHPSASVAWAVLAEEALAARRSNGTDTIGAGGRIALARFFAENVATAGGGLERAIVEGADAVNNADAALAN